MAQFLTTLYLSSGAAHNCRTKVSLWLSVTSAVVNRAKKDSLNIATLGVKWLTINSLIGTPVRTVESSSNRIIGKFKLKVIASGLWTTLPVACLVKASSPT